MTIYKWKSVVAGCKLKGRAIMPQRLQFIYGSETTRQNAAFMGFYNNIIRIDPFDGLLD